MYSRAETAKIRKDFWTAFGQYMKPVPNADGLKVNWQNYKTGVKQIFFRMKAERGFASIGIELNHKDEEIQELVFGQFQEFKRLLEAELQEEWDWELHTFDESGNVVSRIQTVLDKVNVMDKNDWPAIISFLKPRIIALDAFWSNIKPAFEDF
ncbi:hypothetical protein A33Q_3349 [Indibacter alkaliphilus LW1]|jgi:hypothetical protein|uniref:DUF4268 domain-containing protein n=1 Tax=Indibacter alkaliphilus (strain CCUG 57479 / KCTC 22604 / LW1) TaxID=1189612 RepID=S2D8B2_INDAL|nr:DUF4268 domain-containing protein [Indibacter alkaliphilus]EOZ95144.1 hypothetical protein A33Q_3349 [Indibacter alkaliphilus LW1]